MRTLLLALLLAMPAGAAAQTTLSARPVADSLLVWVLNNGAEITIAGERQAADLVPRLYAVPEEGSCVEGTHRICSNHYFLALSEWGEGPRQAVFSLGQVGEMVQPQLVAGRGRERDRLRVRVLNYPADAFEAQPDLVRQERTYAIVFDLETLRITAEP